MIDHATLDLPEELAAGFEAWIEEFWKVKDAPDQFDSHSFHEDGRRLARRLKQFMGERSYVEYDSVDAPAEEIRL
jgi:hypothetical protein